MKIVRKDYSRGAWRLVNGDDQEVYVNTIIDHADLGPTMINGPVCGDTKQQCTDRVLALLGSLSKRNLAKVPCNIDERVSMPAAETQKEDSALIDLRLGSAEHDPKATASASPHGGTPVESGNGTAEALTACREAFKQIRSHCWPFPLTNDSGRSLSMQKIDKADRLALAALKEPS